MEDGLQSQELVLASDGTTTDAASDFSSTNDKLILTPAGTHYYAVPCLSLFIGDSDSAYNKYGNLSALSNGITLAKERLNEAGDIVATIELCSGIAFKQTMDFLLIPETTITPMYDDSSPAAVLGTRIVFNWKDIPLILRGKERERLVIVLADNFEDLDAHGATAMFKKGMFR